MKVTEQHDGETVHPLRPAVKRNILANYSRAVGLDQRGIGENCPHAGRGCDADKFSPGYRKEMQSLWDP